MIGISHMNSETIRSNIIMILQISREMSRRTTDISLILFSEL
jgi:hypothetical protein